VFRAYEVEVINEANTVVVATSGQVAQNTTSTTASWTVPSDLPSGKLRVRVRVYDGAAWSSWSTIRWMIANRPPVANFDWSPKPVWEGDTITLLDSSTDPDGDALTYAWAITGPGGYSANYTTKAASIPSSTTLNRPGTYRVTLTVRDPYNESDTMTRDIAVNANVLTVSIAHSTTKLQKSNTSWEDYRIEKGRSLNTFFAGEPLIPLATTSVNAESVVATFDFPVATVQVSDKYSDVPYPDFSGSATLTSSNFTSWRGHYYENSFYFIPDGTYTVRFTATYQNGTQETETLQVQILDSGLPIIQLLQ